ncbi:Gfo/Idh/MocA family protein [Chloroflexota bacterium]
MTQPLRAGVIGLGIGRTHARGYIAIDGVELVALCDILEDRLTERGAEFPDTQHYTDYRVMLAEANLDMVSVCVPNAVHPEIAIAALEAGLHVCCEKPLAATLEGARSIFDAVQKASGKFTIVHNYRYRADMQWAKQACHDGLLGDIYHVEAVWTRETGIPGGWFTQKEVAGGGPLIDLGVHLLDLALWMLDFPQVQTVSGATRTAFGPSGKKTWGWGTSADGSSSEYSVEDGAVGLLRLTGGTSMRLDASWGDHRRPAEDDMYLRISGSEGAVEISVENYTDEDTLRLYTEINGSAVEVRPKVDPAAASTHEAQLAAQSPHAGLLNAFVQAILEDTAPPAPVAHGLAIVEVLDAFYRSAEQGREVVLA